MSMPNIFMEDTSVGGVPCFTWAIKNYLPKNKRKRETVYRVQMVLLTYFTYALFNMARRPIAVVKSKIIEECNHTYKHLYKSKRLAENEMANATNQWCDEVFFNATTEEFMGFLDFVYLAAYGVCLYLSGIVADCYNPRIYLTTGCLLSGFSCALLGLSDLWGIRNFKFFTLVLIIFGASQSMGWPVVLSCITHWYSGGKRGMFFGFWNTHNYIGSILGIFIAGTWVDKNWGWSFFIPGIILAVMGILVFSCMVVDPDDLKELDTVKTVTSSRRFLEKELPNWLSASRSIKMYDAWKLPGVIEFSACMFFSRMVGYIFLFWLPTFLKSERTISATTAAYYSIAYVLGGSIGGIVAGILVDLFRRSALVCALFLLVSIPVLYLLQLSQIEDMKTGFPLYMLIGLFVEAPYVVTSTSVSADLGTHKIIKRSHRALSTVGGIMEGTGAIGAGIGTYIGGVIMIRTDIKYITYMMMVLQFVATLCLSRQALRDFSKKQKRKTLLEYWAAPSIF